MRPRSTTAGDGSGDIESLESLTSTATTQSTNSKHHNIGITNDIDSPNKKVVQPRKSKSTPNPNNSTSNNFSFQGFLSYIWQCLMTFRKNIKNELNKGLDPNILAMSCSVGVICGLWPVYFTTTFVCGFVDLLFRMVGYPLSTVIIQSINILMGPLEFILAIPFLHLGEYLFSDIRTPLSPKQFALLLKDDPWHLKHVLTFSILGWMFCLPFAFCVIYFISRRYMTQVVRYLAGPIDKLPIS